MAKSLSRPLDLDYFQSLHRLKDLCEQKSYLEQDSKMIAGNLPEILKITEGAVQRNRENFRLDRLDRQTTTRISENQEERRWEMELFLRWGERNRQISGVWDHLVAFQVPLFDQKQKDGWGYIDLMGINSSGVPVIVELKRSPCASKRGVTQESETPLRMVLEAAAYAVAVRKNWKQIREQIRIRLEERDIDKPNLPDSIADKDLPLVAIAPAAFWMDWLPVTGKGRSLSRESWVSFQGLLNKLSEHHYPVKFLSISGSYLAPRVARHPTAAIPPDPVHLRLLQKLEFRESNP